MDSTTYSHLLYNRLSIRLYLLILLVCLIITDSYAQSVSPDWSFKDLHGNTYSKKSQMQKGRATLIYFGSSWCRAAWNYYQSNALQEISERGDIDVLFIESDTLTEINCLQGRSSCMHDTQGDWISRRGHVHIVDIQSHEFEQVRCFNIDQFPLLYLVDQYGVIFDLELSNAAKLGHWLDASLLLDATANIQPINCSSYVNVKLQITGGYGSTYVVWEDGSIYKNRNSVSPDNYTLKISDDLGYARWITLDIPNLYYPIKVEKVVKENPTGQGLEDGTIAVSAIGGSGELRYLWDHGDAGSYITGLPQGNYTFKIVDDLGCQSTHMVSLEHSLLPKAALAGNKTTPVVSHDLRLSPNPCTNYLNIDFGGTCSEIHLKLYNSNGVLTSQYSFKNKEMIQIDVSNFPDGIFHLDAEIDGVKSSHKFLKIK